MPSLIRFLLLALLQQIQMCTSASNQLLLEDLRAAGINIDLDLDHDVHLPTLPTNACLPSVMKSTIAANGYALIDDTFSDNEIERLVAAMKILKYSPSLTHLYEKYAPRLGGDGHRLPSFKGDWTSWGRDSNNKDIQHLRYRLWEATSQYRQGAGGSTSRVVVGDTDVLIHFFPKLTQFHAHMERTFVFKVILFTDSHSFVRVHESGIGSRCSYDVEAKPGRLLIVECSRMSIEMLPMDKTRYLVSYWLREFSGFGIHRGTGRRRRVNDELSEL